MTSNNLTRSSIMVLTQLLGCHSMSQFLEIIESPNFLTITLLNTMKTINDHDILKMAETTIKNHIIPIGKSDITNRYFPFYNLELDNLESIFKIKVVQKYIILFQ